jgi:LPXTG-motif cell wall-anchored protein
MNTTPLSSRARITGLVAAAGVTALTGLLAVAGSAGARSAASADGPRITVTSSVVCSGGDPVGIDFAYDDHVDGHVPLVVEERIFDGSGEVFFRSELHQVNGDYFNSVHFPGPGVTLKPTALYTYQVMISYDDGAFEIQPTEVNLSTACAGTSPTAPPAPQPEPDRFALEQNGFFCGGPGERASVAWHYQDFPDGHYAARADLQVLKNSVLIDQLEVQAPDPSSDGAATELVIPEGNLSDAPLEVASYSLSMTVTYEDGATDKHIETFDLNDLCNGVVNGRTLTPPSTTAPDEASATTTTVPTGTLPETGASESTWMIGAVAGLLTTAGAALFAGVRRSRND